MESYLEVLNEFDEGIENLDMPSDRRAQLGLTEDVKRLQLLLLEQLQLDLTLHIVDYQEPAWHSSLWSKLSADGSECGKRDPLTHTDLALVIRVSNFGRLTTIFGCSEQAMFTFPVERIREFIDQMGFRYMPVKVLTTPYNGIHSTPRRLQGGYTWFDRFFFYPS